MTSSSEQQIGTQIEVPLLDRDRQGSAASNIAVHENQVHKSAQSVGENLDSSSCSLPVVFVSKS